MGEYATSSRTPPRGSKNPDTTTDPYGSPDRPAADELTRVLDAIQSVESFHTSWVELIEKRYRAYRGIAEQRKERTPGWRSKLTTPYILQVIEGMLASMLDPKPTWEVEPRPLPGEPLEEIMGRGQSSKIAGAMLQWAMDEDDFELKQRAFMQQDLIAGLTVAKVVWAYESREMTRLVPIEVEITDDFGQVRDRYMDSEEASRQTVMRDGPSMIVRDVRDFFWPEGAKSVDDAAWIIDRTWSTYDELEAKADAGLYSNCEELKEERNAQFAEAEGEREQDLWSQRRNANLIEVLEYWTDDHVITVGARKVVLASRPNPFRIKRKPFVVCSAMPDAFQMVGISVVESLAQMQEYLWTLQNQRIDVLRLMTNHITIIRSDVDDPDSFEFFPGAQWIVEDPSQVTQLQFDPTAAQVTLDAEALIKGDLQNMMGGLPMAGGVNSGSIDQTTATGMSIITSIAQKMIQARKQNYMWAFSSVGSLFLGMMGQMIREERTISQVGAEGKQQLQQVHPLDLQGEFDVKINVMDESTVREQKRTEAMALMNLAAQLGPMAGLDMKAFMTKVLEAFGVANAESYFAAAPPPGQPGAPPGANPNGTPQSPAGMAQDMQPGGAPIGSQGQTNPGLAAAMGQGGAGGLSLAPDQFAQQQIQAAQQMGGAQG